MFHGQLCVSLPFEKISGWWDEMGFTIEGAIHFSIINFGHPGRLKKRKWRNGPGTWRRKKLANKRFVTNCEMPFPRPYIHSAFHVYQC